MSVHRLVTLAAFILLWAASPRAAEPPIATVSDLGWMTGYWSGPLGDQVMEENWNKPVGGTIAGLVRMAGPQGTQMIELVIIREHEGSVLLTLQQFNPDFTPRSVAPQTMRLVSRGAQTVTFEDSENTPGLKKLTYSRSADNHYLIEALLPSGEMFKADLTSTR